MRVSIERSKYVHSRPLSDAEQRVARERLSRLADKGQQEIELGRGQIDPPAGGTDKVARGFLQRPSREQIELLDRHRVGAPVFAVAPSVDVVNGRSLPIGFVQNEHPHPSPPISIAAPGPANRQIGTNRDRTCFIVNNLRYVK